MRNIVKYFQTHLSGTAAFMGHTDIEHLPLLAKSNSDTLWPVQ